VSGFPSSWAVRDFTDGPGEMPRRGPCSGRTPDGNFRARKQEHADLGTPGNLAHGFTTDIGFAAWRFSRRPGQLLHRPTVTASEARLRSLVRTPRRLGAQLLVLLLVFGAVPLGIAVTVGFVVSRDTVVEQGERALRALGDRQAVHIASELARHRLLLRTITAQFDQRALAEEDSATLGALLRQYLLDDGVFDGLRLVTLEGDILATVALSDLRPHWPAQVPAADWRRGNMAMHWEGNDAIAYLLATPAGTGPAHTWLEGHVRSGDFNRIFTMPSHLLEAAETALYDSSGRLIVQSHDDAPPEMRDLRPAYRDSVAVYRTLLGSSQSLVVAAPVPGTDWVFAAVLPLEAVLAPVKRLTAWASFGALALILAIAATALLAARSVGRPLETLALAARRFGRGEAYGLPPAARTLEVQTLLDEFNHMAGDLRRSRRELQELHDQEMERAQQLATVGELASGVAHEIRNPLTGVLGALDLALRRLPDGDPGKRLLEEARQELQRIERTTRQLLRYAQPPELREIVVDPAELVQRAVQVVGVQASAAGIRIATRKGDDAAHVVRVDPELMVQVLVNLMLNGIQAMQQNGELEVWTEPHGRELWLGVRDTGPGIPPELRSEIFRPFYTTKSTGTGLGLSISRQIVERHGGSLWLEAGRNGGTTFVIALPLIAEEGDLGGRA
jgi:signal transduction histidine kinase